MGSRTEYLVVYGVTDEKQVSGGWTSQLQQKKKLGMGQVFKLCVQGAFNMLPEPAAVSCELRSVTLTVHNKISIGQSSG